MNILAQTVEGNLSNNSEGVDEFSADWGRQAM
jgi:hypothetical protein